MVTRWLCRSLLLLAWSAPVLAQELSGTLTVEPGEVALGESVVIHEVVVNTGSVPVKGVPITLTIIDTARQVIVGEFTDTPELQPGESFQAVRSFRPEAPEGTVFDVLLTALDVGSGELARASFRIKASAPQLEVEHELERRPRVLAYVDCGGHDGKDHRGRRDDDGPGPRCRAARQLDALLDELQVAHVVTRDEWRFLKELRGGRHNVYLVAGRICDEAANAIGELREAVFRGDGLLLDGSAAASALDELAGVERGRRLDLSRSLMCVDGPLFSPARLSLEGRGFWLEPTTGVTQASLHARPGRHHGRDGRDDGGDDDRDDGDHDDGRDHGDRDDDGRHARPSRIAAIVSDEHGLGHTLAYAFELLPSIAAAAASERDAWRLLLEQGLEHLTPQPPAELGALDYAVLATRVTSAAAAPVEVELAFVLPSEMGVEDASPPAPQGPDGVRRARARLAPGETREFRLGLRMPAQGGFHPLDTSVGLCTAGSCSEVDSISFPFEVVSPTDASADVIAELWALPLARARDRAARAAAIVGIAAGTWSFDRGRYGQAIRRFVGAAEALSRIGGADVTPQRLAVARMAAEAERRWSAD